MSVDSFFKGKANYPFYLKKLLLCYLYLNIGRCLAEVDFMAFFCAGKCAFSCLNKEEVVVVVVVDVECLSYESYHQID